MKEKIKRYFSNLDTKKLGIKSPVRVESISRLGMGESNLSYLVRIEGRRFVIRINLDPKVPKKSRREYRALKAIEHLSISPKAYILDETKKRIDSSFIILDYIPGKSLKDSKTKLTKKIISELARTLAGLHSIRLNEKLKRLPEERPDYKSFIREIERMTCYVKKKRTKHMKKGEFENLLDESLSRLKMSIKKAPRAIKTLGHGDLCAQNVINSKNGLELIDFESFGLIDPAAEITTVFEDFGKRFSENQRRQFLEEYGKHRTDKTLRARIKFYTPLKLYEVFIWSLMHVYEIHEKDMHTAFLKDKDIADEIKYSRFCFRRCIKQGTIAKKWSKKRLKFFPKGL
jgi:aminoglycoside phosphotransferase (APT) family kinase protein